MPHTTTHPITADMRACIDSCLKCYAICEETKTHCIGLGGRHARPDHLAALGDCAWLCEAAANFMLRGSELHMALCGVCAEACERCATSCDDVDADDEIMRRCADMCRSCAESCRSMAN